MSPIRPEADAPRLDWRCKGLPARAEGLTGAEIGALGLGLRDMMMPVALIRETAIRHNIGAMQDFADRIGARLAPHGKTSMSPELFAMQRDAGAWAMTAATAHHVRVYRCLGMSRIFLANQLVAQPDLDWIAAELARDPDFDFYCLVDSAEGVAALAAAAGRAALDRPIKVLIETGIAGRRTGVRSLEDGVAVAARIAEAAPRLALVGVETFEGVGPAGEDDARAEAGEAIGFAMTLAETLGGTGLLGEGPVLVSAGGSAFLELVAAGLPAQVAGRPVVTVIRPGCYVTHDHGIYQTVVRPGGMHGVPALRPALEVWGAVQSLPEPGLAIVGIGRRDVSYDSGLPRPIRILREGGGPSSAGGLATIRLWDQHAALAVAPGQLEVGDLVGFGISHPCGTFDRWRALFTASDDDRITGAVTTIF